MSPPKPLRIHFSLPDELCDATSRAQWTYYITERLIGSEAWFHGAGSYEISSPYLIVYKGPEFGRIWPFTKDAKLIFEAAKLANKAGLVKAMGIGDAVAVFKPSKKNMEPLWTAEEESLWSASMKKGGTGKGREGQLENTVGVVWNGGARGEKRGMH